MSVSKFLSEYRVGKNDSKTLVSKDPPSSYFLDEDATEKFFKLYSKSVYNSKIYCLAEMPPKNGGAPLRIDFDLKVDVKQAKGLKRLYSNKDIVNVVKAYQHMIREIVDEEKECMASVLSCVVLEKSYPRFEKDKNYIKDGFHIHFPHFRCKKDVQDKYLRETFLKKWDDLNLFNGKKFIEPNSSILDGKIGAIPWLLYGSSKTLDSEPFLASKFYDENCNEVDIEDIFNDELADISEDEDPMFYLPQLLSIRSINEYETELKSDFIEKMNRNYRRKKKRFVVVDRKPDIIESDIKLIEEGEIMDMLSDSRADDHGEWMKVGWALFNLGAGSEQTLNMWIEFSQRSDKFQYGECEDAWDKMTYKGIGPGWLLSMAKKDSPELFKKWQKQKYFSKLEKSLTSKKPNEYLVSQIVVEMYKDKFVCANQKQNEWYEFYEHRWREMDDGSTLRKIFLEDLVDLYEEYKFKLQKECVRKKKYDDNDDSSETEDEDDVDKKRKFNKIRIAKCNDIIEHLRTGNFHDKLLKMCKIYMSDSKFLEKLNKNWNLFCCENGVLDLDLGIFREGRPEDYCSISCGIDYQEFNKDDDIVKDFELFLRKVFPNENIRKFFLDIAAATMQGGNVNKVFVICTGNGDNGKSVTFKLLQKIFGGYAFGFSREFFAGKTPGSGSARPDLLHAEGKRLGSINEMTHIETIHIGILKEASGGDTMNNLRWLHSNKVRDVKPSHTVWLQCNDPPKVPGSDEPMWTRTKMVDFVAKFVKNCDLDKFPVPETEEEQFEKCIFHADENFSDKIDDLATVGLWYLFNQHIQYRKTGLIVPEEVKIATNRYRKDNDLFLQFVSDKLEKITKEKKGKTVLDKSEYTTMAEMKNQFIEWYKECHPSYYKKHINDQGQITSTFVKNNLSRFLGQPENKTNRWLGYKIKIDKFDEGENTLEEVFSTKKVKSQ